MAFLLRRRLGMDSSGHRRYHGKGGSTSKPIYGNFQRYYHIRNPDNESLDPRLPSILPYLESELIEPRSSTGNQQPVQRILDIGCNSGKVTLQLAQMLAALCVNKWGVKPPELVLGVDIDPALVDEARYATSVAWSRCRPGKGEKREVEFDRLPPDSSYFPACFPHMFRHLPAAILSKEMTASRKRKRSESYSDEKESPAESSSMAAFRSLQFETAEWVNADTDLAHLRTQRTGRWKHRQLTPDLEAQNLGPSEPDYETLLELSQHDSSQYDVILCLALTKWIHVHHGDVGMLRLFARISASLKPGGHLLLERQPWKSYEEARRMGPETRSKMKELQFRPDDFEWVLESVGLVPKGRVGDGPGMGECMREKGKDRN